MPLGLVDLTRFTAGLGAAYLALLVVTAYASDGIGREDRRLQHVSKLPVTCGEMSSDGQRTYTLLSNAETADDQAALPPWHGDHATTTKVVNNHSKDSC
jgi:hypothetical protein